LLNWDYIRYELQHQWRRLAIRQLVNNNPKVIIAVTAVCFFVMLIIVARMLIPAGQPEVETPRKTWFYDLNTNKLFLAKYNATAPVKAPSGPLPDGAKAGVKAHILAYVAEPNESDLVIAFLEKPDPAVATASEQINARKPAALVKGVLIRTVDDPNWVPADGSRGRQIIKRAFSPDDKGRRPHHHLPQ